eukprot:259336-Prorocentrum_minimum.AAC.1
MALVYDAIASSCRPRAASAMPMLVYALHEDRGIFHRLSNGAGALREHSTGCPMGREKIPSGNTPGSRKEGEHWALRMCHARGPGERRGRYRFVTHAAGAPERQRGVRAHSQRRLHKGAHPEATGAVRSTSRREPAVRSTNWREPVVRLTCRREEPTVRSMCRIEEPSGNSTSRDCHINQSESTSRQINESERRTSRQINESESTSCQINESERRTSRQINESERRTIRQQHVQGPSDQSVGEHQPLIGFIGS